MKMKQVLIISFLFNLGLVGFLIKAKVDSESMAKESVKQVTLKANSDVVKVKKIRKNTNALWKLVMSLHELEQPSFKNVQGVLTKAVLPGAKEGDESPVQVDVVAKGKMLKASWETFSFEILFENGVLKKIDPTGLFSTTELISQDKETKVWNFK